MRADACARLAMLLLTAGSLLPRPADAQVTRELGAFSGADNVVSPAPNAPGNGFNNFSGGNNFVGAMGGAMFGNPQQAPGLGGAPFGNGNGGSGMQPNFGWSTETPGLAGATRLGGMRQAFGGGPDGGTAQTETAQATFIAMTQFTQTLLDPSIEGRRSGAAEFDAELSAYVPIGSDRTHGGIGREAYAAIYGKPPLAVAQWGSWATGFGASQTSTAGTGSASRSFATAVGADYSLSQQTQMGFAIAGGGTGFANNVSSGRSDLFQAGAFVRHTAGSAYVATAAAYGWQAITNDHPVTTAGTDQLAATVNANAYSGRIESGYRLTMPRFGITPYAAGQFTIFDLATSAGPPAHATPGNNGFIDSRSEVGLRVSTSFVLGGGLLGLRGRLAWAHDFSATQPMPAVFQAQSGQGFIIGSTALAPNSALTGVAIELRDLNGWYAAANFDSEVSSLVRSYTGKAMLRYAW